MVNVVKYLNFMEDNVEKKVRRFTCRKLNLLHLDRNAGDHYEDHIWNHDIGSIYILFFIKQCLHF